MPKSHEYVALLRGINVGGKNKVAMHALRQRFEALGFQDVTTYIQSGNVIFSTAAKATTIADAVSRDISAHFDLIVPVVVRSAKEMVRIATNNPVLDGRDDTAGLHVMFLANEPASASVAQLDSERSPADEFIVAGREVFLRYGNGSGRSKLTIDYFERTLKTTATARNWNTVTKLAAMTAR